MRLLVLDITGYFQDDSDYGYLGVSILYNISILCSNVGILDHNYYPDANKPAIWLPDPGHASDHMDGLPQVTTIGCLGLMLTSEVSIGVTIQKIWGLTAGGKNAQEWIIGRIIKTLAFNKIIIFKY